MDLQKVTLSKTKSIGTCFGTYILDKIMYGWLTLVKAKDFYSASRSASQSYNNSACYIKKAKNIKKHYSYEKSKEDLSIVYCFY